MRPAGLVLALALCGVVRGEGVRDLKVVCDRAPDCSSLESIVATVTRDCKTDDERAIAIYNFCRFIGYHLAYPNEPGGVSALKLIHVYGWSLCGGQHTMLAALWEKAGYPWRYRGWSNPGHTTVEAFYGGRWHYLDTFLKFYAWRPDPQFPGGRTIASQEDIRAQPALATEAFEIDSARKVLYQKGDRFEMRGEKANWTAPAFLLCGDDMDGVISGIRSSNNSGSPRGWGPIIFDDPGYSTAVNLRPGCSLTLDWDRIEGAWYFAGSKTPPRHSCGDKDYRNCPAIGPLLEPYHEKDPQRTWSNGVLSFRPMIGEGVLASLDQAENVTVVGSRLQPKAGGEASFVVPMASPYVVAKASAKIAGEDARLDVSLDGKKWQPFQGNDLSAAVAGRYCYWVRVRFQKPIAGIDLTSIVQHNQEALPYLAPGKNTIAVTAGGEPLGKNRVAITYAYYPGYRTVPPEDLCEQGAEIARAHNAQWAEKPVVVQRVFDRLPATFEIVVPTPKGKYPAYPRMAFLRREVLAPGQKPIDVPVPPSDPKVGADQTLATLPSPWLMGTQPPAAAPPARPTRTISLAPTKISHVSMKGEVFDHRFIKWMKDNSDAWVLLAAFDPAKLPEKKQLASAKLVFYVEEAHEKAPMEVAAVPLAAMFEPGQPFDFAKLGRPIASTVVAKGGGPDVRLSPPRRYEIDVTREVRGWIGSRESRGLGLRIVPNKGVDDGWTVRFTPDREKPVELEIAVYAQ